jgi:hypothetical protein
VAASKFAVVGTRSVFGDLLTVPFAAALVAFGH